MEYLSCNEIYAVLCKYLCQKEDHYKTIITLDRVKRIASSSMERSQCRRNRTPLKIYSDEEKIKEIKEICNDIAFLSSREASCRRKKVKNPISEARSEMFVRMLVKNQMILRTEDERFNIFAKELMYIITDDWFNFRTETVINLLLIWSVRDI